MKIILPLLALALTGGCASAFSGIAAGALPVGHYSKVAIKSAGSAIIATDVVNDGKTVTFSSAHITIFGPTGLTDIQLEK